MHRIVRAVRAVPGTEDFQFFNGLPTAEMTAPAYKGIGVELYSSAVFAFAPEIALAFHRALAEDDDALGDDRLLDEFYGPLVALRDEVPGYAVSLVKAGVTLRGLDVGGVRAPLLDPAPEHVARLAKLIDHGLEVVRRMSTTSAPHPRADRHPDRVRRPAAAQLQRRARAARPAGHPPTRAGGRHGGPRRVPGRHGPPGAAARRRQGGRRHGRLRHDGRLAAAIDAALLPTVPSSHERGWTTSAIEVACLDAQGKLLGRPVSDLLGGKVRDAVPFAAYLFYKWAEHPALDGRPAISDDWGEALDPAGIVEQARLMQERYGFRSFKLKGGVFPPDEEIAAMRALAEAFPGQPLRLDPNVAWTVETSRYVARELDGVLEYLEDPTKGIPGMAEVAKDSPMPLATNMCVIAWEHLKPAFEQNAIQVLLTDHHYWGGLRRTRELAAVCEAFGLALSMHSNSHLGISLAAMTHVGAAIPNLDHSCDTHYPWNSADDVIVPGRAGAARRGGQGTDRARDSAWNSTTTSSTCCTVAMSTHGMRSRDDTGYMRRIQPGVRAAAPPLVRHVRPSAGRGAHSHFPDRGTFSRSQVSFPGMPSASLPEKFCFCCHSA